MVDSQSPVLLQLGTLLSQLKDHNTFLGHGMGIRDNAILLPGMMIPDLSVSNSHHLER